MPAPTFQFLRFKRGDKAHWHTVHKLLPWFALVLLLVPAGWFATRSDEPIAAKRNGEPVAVAVTASSSPDNAGLPAAPVESAPAPEAPPVTDIFMVRTWEPPPPPPSPEVAPPPPPPPPLPFRFIGRINEPGQPLKFLLAEVGIGRAVHAAKVGDVIATNYRLESFTGGRLVFRFSPMNVRQMLEIGETP